jgi:CDGSH-type Zn-finger protein
MATKLIVKPNGSIRVEGEFTIEDHEGNIYDLKGRTAVSLCRCGLSENKPFCDGRHKDGFEHTPAAFALPEPKA